MKVIANRSVSDPEKAVLPALVWAAERSETHVAYSLSIGWWDWHLTLLWSRSLVQDPRP